MNELEKRAFDLCLEIEKLPASKQQTALSLMASTLQRAIRETLDFHPRAAKLMVKRKSFLVIACDEPYYMTAYGVIRAHESRKGRWSSEDEQNYQSAHKQRKNE